MTTENNVAAQAGDEPMPDLAAAINGLKCTPPDYRNYAMDAEQRGYHKDGFRDGFKAAISAATALAAQVSPRATADVERRETIAYFRKFAGSWRECVPTEEGAVKFIATTKPGS